MARFEIVKRFKDTNLELPKRATSNSAGYDFKVAETTIIPAYRKHTDRIVNNLHRMEDINAASAYSLDDIAKLTKEARPTLVPTGIKCKLDKGTYLELAIRSSSPLKYWLILANSIGIIDSDYYNNPNNEGEIFFQVINLSPYDIILQKGDTIGQGIIHQYLLTEDDNANGERLGGFGSTSK